MENNLPTLVPRTLNPFTHECEWLVYDEQRPVGSDLCVTSGRSIEEAQDKYREYRDYDGKFLIVIGSGEVSELIEGAKYSDIRKKCETDDNHTHS